MRPPPTPAHPPLSACTSCTESVGDSGRAWGGLRALDNVWVADASALPTPGDRHPTLTILAHATRAADATARFLATR